MAAGALIAVAWLGPKPGNLPAHEVDPGPALLESLAKLEPGELAGARREDLKNARKRFVAAQASPKLTATQRENLERLARPELDRLLEQPELTSMDIERLRVTTRMSLLDNVSITSPDTPAQQAGSS